MKKILALDFDGVLCDSLDECLITSVNAYRRQNNLPGWITSLDQIDPRWIELFRRIRPLVRPAGEFWIIAHWLHTQSSMLDQNAFGRLRDENSGTIRNFKTMFFAVRTELRDQDPDRWNKLHRPFPQATRYLDELVKSFDLCLVTNKDLASIKILNRSLGLNISETEMYTGDRGVPKPDTIRGIADKRKISTKQITFVDDQIDHLIDVAATGAVCCWASWGYERNPRRLHGFPKLSELSGILTHSTN
jgi:phosphoglycolate phosphatase-like HAD superfamily hydrolase